MTNALLSICANADIEPGLAGAIGDGNAFLAYSCASDPAVAAAALAFLRRQLPGVEKELVAFDAMRDGMFRPRAAMTPALRSELIDFVSSALQVLRSVPDSARLLLESFQTDISDADRPALERVLCDVKIVIEGGQPIGDAALGRRRRLLNVPRDAFESGRDARRRLAPLLGDLRVL